MVLPKRANGEVGHGPTAPFRSHGLSISKSGVVKMCTEIPRQQGFTLIEMIGVLAVIAILAALVLPKVFDVMGESKVSALVAALKTYEKAVAKYYADIGSILPLDVNGTPKKQVSGDHNQPKSLPARLTLSVSDPLVLTTGLWPKFRGPYLEKFSKDQPPGLGTDMRMPADTAVDHGTAVTDKNRGWDLKGDDGNSDLGTGSHVVFIKLKSVSQRDFLLLDSIIDSDIGATESERYLRGRAKFEVSKDTLRLYLVHR